MGLELLAAGLMGGVGAAVNAQSVSETNQANLQIAEDNCAFQEYMSNTAYQRGVRDMQKAGINPMLAYSQGGSSTPAGSTATMQPTNEGDALKSLASSAFEAERLDKELQQKDSAIALQDASAEAQKVKAQLDRTSARKVAVDTKNAETYGRKLMMDAEVQRENLPAEFGAAKAARTESELREANAQFGKSASTWDNIMSRARDFLGVANNASQIGSKARGGALRGRGGDLVPRYGRSPWHKTGVVDRMTGEVFE